MRSNCRFGKGRQMKKGLTVFVRDNNVDKAIKQLKRRMVAENVPFEMRRREFYEKPSIVNAKRKTMARKRWLKEQRQKL